MLVSEYDSWLLNSKIKLLTDITDYDGVVLICNLPIFWGNVKITWQFFGCTVNIGVFGYQIYCWVLAGKTSSSPQWDINSTFTVSNKNTKQLNSYFICSTDTTVISDAYITYAKVFGKNNNILVFNFVDLTI